jgi:site-specific DNA-methyltransferase (adenine-specific)/modification methylase
VIAVGKYMPVTNDDTTETAIAAYRLLASLFPSAAQVWWGGNYYANELPPSPCWLVWDKENTGNFADCELAWTNQKTAVRIFRHQWNGMLRDSERERRIHPTQKPAALAAWCFDKYTEPAALILDPFCGGGMTVAGAEQSGRRVYAVEMETHYIACVLERMSGMGLECHLAERVDTTERTTATKA